MLAIRVREYGNPPHVEAAVAVTATRLKAAVERDYGASFIGPYGKSVKKLRSSPVVRFLVTTLFWVEYWAPLPLPSLSSHQLTSSAAW